MHEDPFVAVKAQLDNKTREFRNEFERMRVSRNIMRVALGKIMGLKNDKDDPAVELAKLLATNALNEEAEVYYGS